MCVYLYTKYTHVCMLSFQSCLTLYNPMDSSLPGCSIHGKIEMGFSRQEYWSGLPFPLPGGPSDLGKAVSPVLQVGSLALSHQGSPYTCLHICLNMHMHTYMSSWQSSRCFWIPTNFLSLFPPKRKCMSPSFESGLTSDSYIIPWLWQKWCYVISEASAEKTMQVLPCSPECLHRSPGLAWEKLSHPGDPRWLQHTVPRPPPAEAPDTREPGRSVPSCVCWDSWPTGPADRKRDCHMQLNFRKVWHVTRTTSNSNTSGFFLDFTLLMFLNHFFNIEKTGCHYSQNIYSFAQSFASCKQSPHHPGFIFTCPHLLPWPLGILLHSPHCMCTHTHTSTSEHQCSADDAMTPSLRNSSSSTAGHAFASVKKMEEKKERKRVEGRDILLLFSLYHCCNSIAVGKLQLCRHWYSCGVVSSI